MAIISSISSYKELPNGQRLCFNPKRIEGKACGVLWVEQNKRGRITLIYEDRSKESAYVKGLDLGTLPNLFTVVQAVQCKARKQAS